MLKKLFAKGYFGIPVLLFYGLGALFWHFALVSDASYQGFFITAAALFTVGLLWSLRWLWRLEFFRRSRRRFSRRFSDQNPDEMDVAAIEYVRTHAERRRRRPRKSMRIVRAIALGISTLIFAVIGIFMGRSYTARVADIERPAIEVFLADAERLRAMPAPFLGSSPNSRALVFALAGVPTKEIPIHPQDHTVKMNVVLRNVSHLDIQNVRIDIASDIPIKPADHKLEVISDTEVGVEVLTMRPFGTSGDELTFPLEIPVPAFQTVSGLFVTVDGNDLRTYSAASKLWFMKKFEKPGNPGSPPTPDESVAQPPAPPAKPAHKS